MQKISKKTQFISCVLTFSIIIGLAWLLRAEGPDKDSSKDEYELNNGSYRHAPEEDIKIAHPSLVYSPEELKHSSFAVKPEACNCSDKVGVPHTYREGYMDGYNDRLMKR